jgi:hypothetical protein
MGPSVYTHTIHSSHSVYIKEANINNVLLQDTNLLLLQMHNKLKISQLPSACLHHNFQQYLHDKGQSFYIF